MITRERLEAYRSQVEEIKELEYDLRHLKDDDRMMGNDVIFDYSTGFPRPQTVVGFDKEKYDRKKNRLKNKIHALRVECEEIEAFVENISNGEQRRIIRMIYINGMTQQAVSLKMHMDQATISRRIKKFFQKM